MSVPKCTLTLMGSDTISDIWLQRSIGGGAGSGLPSPDPDTHEEVKCSCDVIHFKTLLKTKMQNRT